MSKIWPYQTGGIPDEMFIRGKVPMTKEEIRVITISKLRLEKNSIIYDIGAGTGSLTVEAALQADQGQVFAIEKEKKGIDLVSKNIKKFGLNNVKLVYGEAPSVLKELPVVDRVIIGGSGGNLKEILNIVSDKLTVDGKVVINAVTVNTLSTAFRVLKEFNYNFKIFNISVSRDKDVAGYKMLTALNPVYIICAVKNN